MISVGTMHGVSVALLWAGSFVLNVAVVYPAEEADFRSHLSGKPDLLRMLRLYEELESASREEVQGLKSSGAIKSRRKCMRLLAELRLSSRLWRMALADRNHAESSEFRMDFYAAVNAAQREGMGLPRPVFAEYTRGMLDRKHGFLLAWETAADLRKAKLYKAAARLYAEIANCATKTQDRALARLSCAQSLRYAAYVAHTGGAKKSDAVSDSVNPTAESNRDVPRGQLPLRGLKQCTSSETRELIWEAIDQCERIIADAPRSDLAVVARTEIAILRADASIRSCPSGF